MTYFPRKNIKNEYGAYRRYFFVNGEKGINFNLKKTLNSFTGFMKVSDPVRLKLVISYEQSNQGITIYFFHENNVFVCTWTYAVDVISKYNLQDI